MTGSLVAMHLDVFNGRAGSPEMFNRRAGSAEAGASEADPPEITP